MSSSGDVLQGQQQKRTPRTAEVQHSPESEPENLRQADVPGRKKPLKISLTNKSPASPSNNSPMSPTDIKTKNTGLFFISKS